MGKADSSITRRQFLGATAGGTIVSAVSTRAWTRVQGANDRVRLGLIGCGSRGAQVSNLFLRHPDAQYVAGADVFIHNTRPGALTRLGLDVGDELMRLFYIGSVVVFSGHMLDQPAARGLPPRFPADPQLIRRVSEAIKESFVHAMHVGILVAIVFMAIAGVVSAIFVRSHVTPHGQTFEEGG